LVHVNEITIYFGTDKPYLFCIVPEDEPCSTFVIEHQLALALDVGGGAFYNTIGPVSEYLSSGSNCWECQAKHE